MSPVAPIEPLVAIKPLDGAGPDVFVNANPPWNPGKGVRAIFGGFLLAHAVSAAQATVPPPRSPTSTPFAAHSLQATFLRPGSSTFPIEYHVERIADGRSTATRLVRAIQNGKQLFIATVGLAGDNNGRSGVGSTPISLVHQYSEPMPDFGRNVNPEDLSKDQTQVLLRLGYTRQMMATGPTDPFEWRHLPLTETGAAGQQDAPTNHLGSFVRLSQPLEGEKWSARGGHLAALAFLTDEWLLATSNLMRSDLSDDVDPNHRVQIQIAATMNHSILFHDATVRADEWMVSERTTTWADGGRVLVLQKLWSRSTGKLLLSCWQEGLVRLGRVTAAGKL